MLRSNLGVNSHPGDAVMDGMIDAPQMLMIGSTGRDSGKTELVCSLIDKFSAEHEVVAVKVTTVKDIDEKCTRSCADCAVCTDLSDNYLITREIDEGRGKDTERMVAAGASRVFWLRVLRDHLREGTEALLKGLGKDALVICESNSVRSLVSPGAFLMCNRRGERSFKESAEAVRKQVDRLVTFTDGDAQSFDLNPDDVEILPGGWALRADAAAVILAGGMSRRMQVDKSMLPIAGRPMLEHIHGQLLPHFKQTLVSANDVDMYSFLGVRIVPDAVAGLGPLMGIASALQASEHELNFVTACDMPEVDVALVRRMLREVEGFDGVVPIANGFIEPLCAVYRKSVISSFKDTLAQGQRKIRAALDRCRINYIDITETEPLKNLNTREDYSGFIAELDDEPKD
mgnify:CR=1 FL=1|jgi:molybdopterin-guanine dinucleotide biosynthesis protein A|tara:strand:+ start:48 stop:1250 length:1203 start_codon:yes stop_codon:yes gene_type:complete